MAKTPEEMALEINQKIDGFKAELDKASTKEEFDSLEAKIKELEEKDNSEELKNVQTELKELKENIALLKDNNGGNGLGESFEAILEKSLTEALPKLKSLKGEAGDETPFSIEITVKAPVNMTTGAITNQTATPVSFVYQQVTEYAEDVRPEEYIINYLDNGSTNKASLPYMDKLPTEGTMAVTAEGALKPLISISFKLRYSEAKKIAGRTKVSEEALDDIPNLMAIIRNELAYEHRIAEQAEIFTFVNSVAPAFVAGGMAGSTNFPSNWDALRAAIYAIKIQSNGRYIPNAALVPSADVYNMGATKDTLGQYVIPTFVLPDGTRVSGVRIIEVNDDSVAEGSFIVGDWRKFKRRVYKSFTVRIGQGIVGNATAANIVSDFESNMYTMIGESRQHLYIYENEKVAFIKSTFAAVKTAIEAPAEE